MSYIFFGWLLVFLNFTINGFDILPDFIGYLLIFAGVNKLAEKSPYFGEARIFALVMCMVSFSDLLHLETVTIESESLFMLLLMTASILMTFIPVYLMYLITRGVADLEWETGVCLGADTLMRIWKINLFATLLLCAAGLLSVVLLNILAGLWLIVAVLTICILVFNIAWAICFYKCKKQYDEATNNLQLNGNRPHIQPISAVLAVAVCILIGALTLLSCSEYAEIRRGGIAYIETVCFEKYKFTEYAAKDSDVVVIDWNDVQAAVGQELYNDGACVIYISVIEEDQNGGYDIFFKTRGEFGYKSGRLVTPLSHIDDQNEEIVLQDIHKNWTNDAVLQVTIGDKTYLSEKWHTRVKSFDKDGDEMGYPMFSIDCYDHGEMILADEIRRNDNKVSIRLIGLRELTYERI